MNSLFQTLKEITTDSSDEIFEIVFCGAIAIWLDAHAQLARLGLQARSNTYPPATVATTATKHARVAVVAEVPTPPPSQLVIDLLEERAAIQEYDGGQTRTEPEAAALEDVAQTTGIAPAQLSLLWEVGANP